MPSPSVRNHAFDKTSLPKPGYYWIPATSDTSTAFLSIGHKPTKQATKLGISSREIEGQRNKVFEFESPTWTTGWTTGSVKSLAAAGYENIDSVGMRFFRESKFALYGAPNAPKNGKSRVRDAIRKRAFVLQDSGGFQLATGVEDFIDPDELILNHNQWADAGVALDIPGFGVKDRELLRRTAAILVANNEKMARNAEKPLRLVNVCHGRDLHLRQDYIKDILKGPPLDALCVGGLRQSAVQAAQDPEDFAAHVLLTIFMTSKVYDHYHVLGVATNWQMVLLSLIAEVTQKVVTSDSASHHLSGKSGILIQYADRVNNRIGRELDFNPAWCCCPVCSAMKQNFIHKLGTPLSATHNGYALLHVAATCRGLAKYDAKTADNHYMAVASHGQPLLMRKALKLIRTATKVSDLQLSKPTSAKSLFGNKQTDAARTKNEQRILFLIKQYEKYHGKKF